MSSATNPVQPTTQTGDAVGVSLVRILIAIAVSIVLNLVILWIGTSMGAPMLMAMPQPIDAITVIGFTAMQMLIPGVIVWLLAKRWAIRRFMAWAGLAFALLTIGASFAFAADTSTAITLGSMHVVAGVAWLIALQPWVTSPAA